jgi:hypothetical protein
MNGDLGERSRVIGYPWTVLWPKLRHVEENHDIGVALEPE